MSDFFSDGARYYQTLFETQRLAERAHDLVVHDTITDEDRAFLESRDFFFLATVDKQGQPQCSYKGGAPGFIKVVDEKTVAFPSYDGNGMFLSMGNMRETQRVGLLFIDFENPHRFRLNGIATVHENDPLLTDYHEAQLIVKVAVREMFINCPRYIHRFQRLSSSPHVPQHGSKTPMADWKRLDVVQDVLPERDKQRLAEEDPNH